MCFPLWSLFPFVGMLLSIAVLPLVIPNWWDSNRNKFLLSIIVSLPVLFVVLQCNAELLLHSLLDYFSFLVLLGSLFVISGGVYIRGAFAGTPLVNTAFLAIGAVLANLIGTTGASMLMIRPYMRENHVRQHRALVVGTLLVVFNIFDQYVFNKEDVETPGALVEDVQSKRRVHIDGSINFIYLFGVMTAAALSGYFGWPRGVQETLMIVMALLSWFTTPRKVHEANHFHIHPIVEVAALFLGIFITMVPALEILHARAIALNLREPWHYFWMSGLLSSVLDNAPTYLTFTAMATGIAGGQAENLQSLLNSGLGARLLTAVSCGSVFMGANTYIGNGPNFMVKSIAERSGVKMPSFGGYMIYSGLILIPLFVVVTLVFFR